MGKKLLYKKKGLKNKFRKRNLLLKKNNNKFNLKENSIIKISEMSYKIDFHQQSSLLSLLV